MMNTLSPYIFTVPDFLSPKECQFWIERTEAGGYEEALVNWGGKQVKITSVRNNERFMLDDHALERQMWERVKDYVPQTVGNMTACGLNERFRFYKYQPGHRFKPHQDGSYRRGPGEWSEYTFMVYLNEDMEGGATNFKDISIKPETGMALIFKHELPHEGAKVTAGLKYVLRSDVMYRRNA